MAVGNSAERARGPRSRPVGVRATMCPLLGLTTLLFATTFLHVSLVSAQGVILGSPFSTGKRLSGGGFWTTFSTNFSSNRFPSGSFSSSSFPLGNFASGSVPIESISSGSYPIGSVVSSGNYPSGELFSVTSQSSVANKNPIFEFLSPTGLRISIPGPYQRSSVYLLKFFININHGFNGVKRGEWEGEVRIPSGETWTYTFPDIRLRQADTIYYWVEVKGRDGQRSWFREYEGYYQIPDSNPHQAQDSWLKPRPPQVYQPQVLPGGSGNVDVSNMFYRPDGGSSSVFPIDVSNSFTNKQDPHEKCRMSSTTFNNGRRLCVGEYFDELKFQTVEQVGKDQEETFTVYSHDNVSKNVSSHDNSAHSTIFPSLLEDRYGPQSIDGRITLEHCTSQHTELCSARAQGYLILPPIISGRETTEKSLSFCYGVLEVIAKLPKGDWIVPELWLLPKDHAYGDKSGKIVLAMARGNTVLMDGAQAYGNRVLEAGVQIGSDGPAMFRKAQISPWSDNYHKFKLIWTPDQLQFYVDDNEIGSIRPPQNGLDPSLRGSKLAPFDKEFYLAFGIHVGGDKDFLDSLKDKPWINFDPKNKVNFWRARNKWQPTWSDAALHIASITLRALDK